MKSGYQNPSSGLVDRSSDLCSPADQRIPESPILLCTPAGHPRVGMLTAAHDGESVSDVSAVLPRMHARAHAHWVRDIIDNSLRAAGSARRRLIPRRAAPRSHPSVRPSDVSASVKPSRRCKKATMGALRGLRGLKRGSRGARLATQYQNSLETLARSMFAQDARARARDIKVIQKFEGLGQGKTSTRRRGVFLSLPFVASDVFFEFPALECEVSRVRCFESHPRTAVRITVGEIPEFKLQLNLFIHNNSAIFMITGLVGSNFCARIRLFPRIRITRIPPRTPLGGTREFGGPIKRLAG
jgi:hypothetical protein